MIASAPNSKNDILLPAVPYPHGFVRPFCRLSLPLTLRVVLLGALCLVSSVSFGQSVPARARDTQSAASPLRSAAIEARVDKLLKTMTLEEKI